MKNHFTTVAQIISYRSMFFNEVQQCVGVDVLGTVHKVCHTKFGPLTPLPSHKLSKVPEPPPLPPKKKHVTIFLPPPQLLKPNEIA